MKWPPCLMRIRVLNENNSVHLWVPVFLIWPFVAIIMIILLPLVLLLGLILWPSGWGKYLFKIGPGILMCLFSLRGLEVDVQQPWERFQISMK
jgi:hypothetical protein